MSTRRSGDRLHLASESASSSSPLAQRRSASIVSSEHHKGLESHSRIEASSSSSRAKRDLSVSFTFGSTDTNATVETAICSDTRFNSSTQYLYLSGNAGKYFKLPSCILTKGTGLTDLTIYAFVISGLDELVPNLSLLRFTDCLFTPGFNAFGFDGDGNLDWNMFWARYPALSYFITAFSPTLRGTLPATVPNTIEMFDLRGCTITGNVPSTLFSNYASVSAPIYAITLNLGSLALSGPLPSSLFSPFAGKTIATFSLNISANALNGAIPDNFLQPLQTASIASFTLLLKSNKLSSFPSTTPFLFTGMFSTGAKVTIDLSQNLLTGGLSANAFNGPAGVNTFSFNARGNQMTGTLPIGLFSATFWSSANNNLLLLDLTGNGIQGNLPSDLVTSSISGIATFTRFEILLGSNALTGSIPTNFLSYVVPDKRRDDSRKEDLSRAGSDEEALDHENASTAVVSKQTRSVADSLYAIRSSTITFDLSSNAMTGTVPADLLNNAIYSGGSSLNVRLSLTNNSFSGEFPNSVIAATTLSASLAGTVTVEASRNSFWGSLPSACYSLLQVSYTFSYNQLNGTFPATSWHDCSRVTVDVSNNPRLFGELPPTLLNDSLYILKAANTPLSGSSSRIVASPRVSSFDLSGTDIDFCSNPWTVPSALRINNLCKLDNTTACGCTSLYTGCSLVCVTTPRPPVPPPLGLGEPTPLATPLAGPIAIPSESVTPPTSESPTSETPTSEPTSEVVPTIPPSTPLPAPSPTGCNGKTRPSPAFECVDGTWVASSVTNITVLVIPSGAGSVIVNGNVSSTSIVFNSIGSTIIIEGCASNLSSIVVELTQEQLKELGKTKTLQNLVTLTNASSCEAKLNEVALTTSTEKGCRKVKTEKAVSDPNTFGAYFSVDSGGCNRWWIILVSVIVVVVIVGTAATVIGIVLWQRHQNKANFAALGPSSAQG